MIRLTLTTTLPRLASILAAIEGAVPGTAVTIEHEPQQARHTRQATLAAEADTSTADSPSRPQPRQSDRAKVAYQVDPTKGTWSVGTIPERIRLYLLSSGPRTARQVENDLGLGRKSVESAVHTLRANGIVIPVPVESVPPVAAA